MTIQEYLEKALNSFKADPASTRFQKGYEAALRDTLEFIQSPNISWSREVLAESELGLREE